MSLEERDNREYPPMIVCGLRERQLAQDAPHVLMDCAFADPQLAAEGRSNAGIAQSLVLTIGAVEKHVQSILSKLDLPQSAGDHRRVLAVLAYLQETE